MEATWRINKETYLKESHKIREVKESTDTWAKLFLNPDLSNDERMLRIMMNNDPNKKNSEGSNYICQSYMCRNMLPQEFIRDALYINSGIALIGCWDDDVINWVLNIYEKRVPDRGKPYGNALEDVLKAYETDMFKTSCPKYHKYLKHLIDDSGYYDYVKQLKSFKITSHKPDEIVKQIDEMKAISDRYKKCEIRVTNRLDWELIPTFNLDTSFVERFYRNTSKTVMPEEDKNEK